ncbi:gas vesicle protein K [Micromonospora thermarum]|uniref:Gas vesicle protein K n=1 Tax=Micromonospora thermarum TaxID=2720024 RepID=A0ABX0Z2J6_9ACTN|nr:gas vesicle protein K [Micromonospora thermarum]NJP31539.1 gas vesicle protein K [Micromonospora thermarum]
MTERDEAAELAAAVHGPAAALDGPAWRTPRVTPLDRRLAVDQDSVERGLASLVLTVIELLRQLMERQALRRVDLGDLTEEQVERIGTTLMALEEQMAELRTYFGLAPEDLNLDLGPLGPLLPTD